MFRDTLCVTTLLKKFWNASNIKVVYSQRHVDIPMKFSGRIIRLPTIGDVSKSNTALDRSRRKGSSRAEGNGYTEGCFLGRPEERGRSLDRCPVGNRRVVLPVVYEQGRSCSTLVSSSSTLFLSLFLSLFLLFSSLLFSSDLVSLFLRSLVTAVQGQHDSLARFRRRSIFRSSGRSRINLSRASPRISLPPNRYGRRGWFCCLFVCLFSLCFAKYRWKTGVSFDEA